MDIYNMTQQFDCLLHTLRMDVRLGIGQLQQEDFPRTLQEKVRGKFLKFLAFRWTALQKSWISTQKHYASEIRQ